MSIKSEGPTDLLSAIAHANEVAEREGCTECGQQHRQLAAWLTELMTLRELSFRQKLCSSP